MDYSRHSITYINFLIEEQQKLIESMQAQIDKLNEEIELNRAIAANKTNAIQFQYETNWSK
jgi:hypothetical protein